MTDEPLAIPADMPVLDDGALERLQRIGGVELVNRMIRAFLEHVPARVDALQAATDAEAAGRIAHAVRSSAGNLGLGRLHLVAQEIEMRAELGDDTWLQLRAVLADALTAARVALVARMEAGA